MSKDQLIAKQQIQIEEYKEMLKENTKLKSLIRGKFYNIGQPLNDNLIKMTKSQMKWCLEVVESVDELHGLTVN